MKLSDKLRIVNLASWLMITCIVVMLFFFTINLFTETFGLKVFTHRADKFLQMLALGAVCVIVGSAILTFVLNISIIAESKVDVSQLEPSSFLNKKLLYRIGIILSAFIILLFLGNYLTEKFEKNKLQTVAEGIITKYNKSFEQIADGIGEPSRHKAIFETLDFLSNQRSEFPSIKIITQGNYNGDMALLEVRENDTETTLGDDVKEVEIKPTLEFPYYQCSGKECTYLENFFSGKGDEKYILEDDGTYTFYHGVTKKNKKFVIIFSRTSTKADYDY